MLLSLLILGLPGRQWVVAPAKKKSQSFRVRFFMLLL